MLQKTAAEPVEVSIIGVVEGNGGATVLLSDSYEEYSVPAALHLHIAAEDLPINLKLTHSNKVVQSIEPLGELMEEVFESL